jgi:hypothetical protein
MTGSMLISNSQGERTLLTLSTASAAPLEALHDARAALRREKSNPSTNATQITFLEAWITMASPPIPEPTPIPGTTPAPIKVPITPPDKTSIRLAGQPWEKDSYLKNKVESETATASANVLYEPRAPLASLPHVQGLPAPKIPSGEKLSDKK